jgi:hypothetical protein
MANMTKKEKFTAIRNSFKANPIEVKGMTEEEVLDFFEHEIDLLNSKSGALKKKTPQQEENDRIMAALIDFLTEQGKPMTIAEILAAKDERLVGIKGNQHLNSLLIKLRNAGEVARTYDKKTAYFGIGAEDENAK